MPSQVREEWWEGSRVQEGSSESEERLSIWSAFWHHLFRHPKRALKQNVMQNLSFYGNPATNGYDSCKRVPSSTKGREWRNRTVMKWARIGTSRMENPRGREVNGNTHCCWRLSCLEHRVSHPGKGHLWLRSPVWTRACLDKCPLVVKAL